MYRIYLEYTWNILYELSECFYKSLLIARQNINTQRAGYRKHQKNRKNRVSATRP